MKLTNREVFESREPLQTLLTEKFPVKVSYALAKLTGHLNVHLKAIEDVRGSLVRQYGSASVLGQITVVPGSADYEEFAKKFNELMAVEVEIDYEPHIVLPAQVGGKPVEVTPGVLLALEKFITIEGERGA